MKVFYMDHDIIVTKITLYFAGCCSDLEYLQECLVIF